MTLRKLQDFVLVKNVHRDFTTVMLQNLARG